MSVRYRLADKPSDLQLCYELMDQEKTSREGLELKTPCVLAFKDEDLVGFLGTHTDDELVFGGPLVMRHNEDPPMLVVYQLCELYEISMRQIGIKSYIMSVEDDTFFDQAIKRYNPPNMEQYAREGNKTFYVRRL